MILEELRLKNFRCFYDEGVIRFSTDPKRDVTLIYAENGVGKTTLLNAMLWCLYGETTKRFEKKEDILNHEAKERGKKNASVALFFEHDDKHYVAKRFFELSGEMPLRVARIEGGRHEPLDAPDTFVNSVIPKDMIGHFLFDGEHAENFSGETNKSRVQAAVRDILGCTLIQLAIEDLKALSTKYRKQITSFSISDEIEGLDRKIQNLTTSIATAQIELHGLKDERGGVADQLGDIELKLRSSTQVQEFQKAREGLEAQLRHASAREKQLQDDVFKWLGDNGRLIVSTGITEQTYEFLELKENKAKIPAPYNEEFVKDILAAHKCVCGRPFEEGSDEEHEIQKLLNKAANKIMTDRIIRIRARITSLREQRKRAPQKLLDVKKKLAKEHANISTLEAQIGEYSDKIKGVDVAEIKKREERYQELRKRLSEIDGYIGVLAHNIGQSEAEQKAHEKKIMGLSGKDKEAQKLIKKRDLCIKLQGYLEDKLVEDEKDTRTVLRFSISKIIEETTRQNFQFKMAEDYTMQLLSDLGVPLAKSGGENQLLGLAFTAALVELAKIRKGAQDFTLLPGTIAPLVLDSPFGQLDDAYRKSTAEFLPRMAQQVVLMLSSSQANSAIIETLGPHIGKQYVLVRHNKDRQNQKHKPNETRVIDNRQFVITVFNSYYNGTEIMEVA